MSVISTSHGTVRRSSGRVPSARSWRRRTATVLAAAMSAASLSVIGAGSAAAEALPPGFSVVPTPTGTGTVIEVAYAPDGRTFVTEKSGRVKVVSKTGAVTQLLDLRNRVNDYSDRGLLGMALDKDFATNGWLYLLYSQEIGATPDGSGPMTSVLSRVTVNPDSTVANPSAPETIILGKDGATPCPVPDNTRDCMPADHYWHVIGTVRVDPVDGTLWVGSGDAHPHRVDETSYRPYDEASTAGKILHVDRNGKGLVGHPFCQGEADLTKTCTKIYAKGFRNPYRFHLRPGKGPAVGDVGHSQQEELNLIQPGRNYGWPCYEGTARTQIYATTSTCAALYAQEGIATSTAAATPPSWSYPHGGGASIVGGPVYDGTSYPAEMRGDLFVGDYVQGWVKRLDVDAQDRVTAVHDFASDWTGVSLATAPTGELADVDMGWSSGAPAVRRYVFAGTTDAPPTARATATPARGVAPLVVKLDGSTSSDPDGGALTYRWDFGDGTPASTAVAPSHTYASAGTYTATLTVTDPTGKTGTAGVTVTADAAAGPTVAITSPGEGATYRNGVRVPLTATATAASGAALTGSSIAWQVRLQHGTHLHEVANLTGESTSFVPLLDHDADSFYELRATATDAKGVSTTITRTIKPQTATLTLASTPTGAGVTYEGAPATAPSNTVVAVGFRPTVGAADTVVSGGKTYTFDSWSDGGAQQHAIDMPATALTLTARYVEVPPPSGEEVTFLPAADTYVVETSPTTSYGTSSQLRYDASPGTQSFVRFPVSGLNGRPVLAAKLVLRQSDASASGGRVRAVSGTWSETSTWNTRPTLGTVLGEVGAVSMGNDYTVNLPAGTVTADGQPSFGFDSLHNDGATWASRHTATPPRLILTLGGEGTPPPPPPPPPTGEQVTFTPAADTYVTSAAPTTSYGTSSQLRYDASPIVQSYARFSVAGLNGRKVLAAKLVLRQSDASPSGGRVRAVSGTWSETTTYNTRPTLGAVLAEVTGAVSMGNDYTVDLPAGAVTADGQVSFGFDSLHSDGATWASRHTGTPPRLVLTLGEGDEEPPPPPPPPPPPSSEELTFTPTSDTYVVETSPTSSYGASSRLIYDASPNTQSFAQFSVSGLNGRPVLAAKLVLRQTDASASGGRVRGVSGAWSETTTWNTRPTLGTVLGEVGAVSAGNDYTVNLPAGTVSADGSVSFGFDSLHTDGATWASRHTPTPPRLVLTVGSAS